MAVAAHARVRGQPGGVVGQPGLDDAGAELVAQVERQVRHAHAVGERARAAHRASAEQHERSASLSGVAPQLERDARPARRPRAHSSAATALSTPPLIATSVRPRIAASSARIGAARRRRARGAARRRRGRPRGSLPGLRPPSSSRDRRARRSRAASRTGGALDELDGARSRRRSSRRSPRRRSRRRSRGRR